MAESGTLHDAFIDELKDAYDGEKQLTKALAKMARAATSPELRAAFESHPQHLRIRVHYEDLRQNPISAIGALFRHLGRKIAPDELLKLAERTRIESFPPSERGSDKPRQNGVVGGYRDYFYDDEIATMNAIMGPNLVRYGYSL